MPRVRIIGGRWRSRLVDFPSVAGLRPTPDRVRETLFNWIGQDVSGTTCLDLFAGSGVLGFEAASRGAEHVTLVERNSQAFAALQRNGAALGASNLELRNSDARNFLRTAEKRYDIVFLDPPYGGGWLEQVAELLRPVLAPGAVIYAECERPLPALGDWRATKQQRAGQVHYQLFDTDNSI